MTLQKWLAIMCSAHHGNDESVSLKWVEWQYFCKSHCHLYNEMMGLIGAGNNPMVGMTVAVAVAVEEVSK